MFAGLALVVNPAKLYNKFPGYFKLVRGLNNSTLTANVGRVPFIMLWVAASLLIASLVGWIIAACLNTPKQTKAQPNIKEVVDGERPAAKRKNLLSSFPLFIMDRTSQIFARLSNYKRIHNNLETEKSVPEQGNVEMKSLHKTYTDPKE